MKNLAHRYLWGVIPIILIFPFVVNWLINLNTPSWWSWGVAGEGKDWLPFWGAYISSLSTAIMAFLTYRIIKQNENARRGLVAIRITLDEYYYNLELVNPGNSPVYITKMRFVLNSSDTLWDPIKEMMSAISKSKILLLPNEKKVILIAPHRPGDYKFNETFQNFNNVAIDTVKKTILDVQVTYETVSKIVVVEESFCFGDWTGLFLAQKTVIGELSEISSDLSIIEQKMKN